MLKAGALYLALIISLIIGIICSSLILMGYYYRSYEAKQNRYHKLADHINAGIQIALNEYQLDTLVKNIDLFEDQKDSITIKTSQWGIFKLAAVSSHIQTDSVKKVFLIGNETKQDQSALYLSDEDRPLSVSGETKINGDVAVSKAGIKKSYVDGKPYAREKMVYGKIKESGRLLPTLNALWIKQINERLNGKNPSKNQTIEKEMYRSFSAAPLIIHLTKKMKLTGMKLSGQIILISDSAIHIATDTKLENIQVFAPAIQVENGFNGHCQLYARDSIIIGKGSTLSYPSVLAVFKQKGSVKDEQPKIELQENVKFSGIIISQEPERSTLQTLIHLKEKTTVKGEIFSSGFVQLTEGANIIGKISCNRFIMKLKSSLYENYLININLDRLSRNPFYLSSPVFYSSTHQQQQILQWLE